MLGASFEWLIFPGNTHRGWRFLSKSQQIQKILVNSGNALSADVCQARYIINGQEFTQSGIDFWL